MGSEVWGWGLFPEDLTISNVVCTWRRGFLSGIEMSHLSPGDHIAGTQKPSRWKRGISSGLGFLFASQETSLPQNTDWEHTPAPFG